MVELLGLRDEVLRTIETGFTGVDIHVRGNEVTLAGPAATWRGVAARRRAGRDGAGGTPLTAEVVDPLGRHADGGRRAPGRRTSCPSTS